MLMSVVCIVVEMMKIVCKVFELDKFDTKVILRVQIVMGICMRGVYEGYLLIDDPPPTNKLLCMCMY